MGPAGKSLVKNPVREGLIFTQSHKGLKAKWVTSTFSPDLSKAEWSDRHVFHICMSVYAYTSWKLGSKPIAQDCRQIRYHFSGRPVLHWHSLLRSCLDTCSNSPLPLNTSAWKTFRCHRTCAPRRGVKTPMPPRGAVRQGTIPWHEAVVD